MVKVWSGLDQWVCKSLVLGPRLGAGEQFLSHLFRICIILQLHYTVIFKIKHQAQMTEAWLKKCSLKRGKMKEKYAKLKMA